MMVQTLIPCSPASKTEEILSRYRPIAPKPEIPSNTGNGGVEETPHKLRQSPYLRNIWAHLQSRPTRTRKRGRSSSITPSSSALKRHQNHKIAQTTTTPFLGLCCPSPLASPSSMQGFMSPNLIALEEKPITLPLLSSSSPSSSSVEPSLGRACQVVEPLEEKDLILQLKSPTNNNNNPWSSSSALHVVVAPKPIRPIGSTIRVGPIRPTQEPDSAQHKKKPEEVEDEVEAEEFPAVISDSNNKVRMANSAYKELVGQPECPWLDSLTASVAGRRISGEVVLHVSPGLELPGSSNGFSCWAKIEWGNRSVDALCDVMRLHCDSKYYLFSWKFHTKQATSNLLRCNFDTMSDGST